MELESYHEYFLFIQYPLFIFFYRMMQLSDKYVPSNSSHGYINRSVVLAKGGIREKYRSVSDSSAVCSSSDPVGIVELLHPREIYIADLNMLQDKGPLETNTGVIREVSLRADTMLDFGISTHRT